MTKDAELQPQLREAEHRGWSWSERQELRPMRAPCSAGHSSTRTALGSRSSHTLVLFPNWRQLPLCKMNYFSPCSEKWETEKAVLELIKTILIASWSLTARFQLTPKSHLYPLQLPILIAGALAQVCIRVDVGHHIAFKCSFLPFVLSP